MIVGVAIGCAILCCVSFLQFDQDPEPQRAHFYLRGSYFYCVPFELTNSQIPYVEMEVAGKTVEAIVDLGSNGYIMLHRHGA